MSLFTSYLVAIAMLCQVNGSGAYATVKESQGKCQAYLIDCIFSAYAPDLLACFKTGVKTDFTKVK